MGIGPTTDEEAIRHASTFKGLLENLRSKGISHIDMEYLSMGMSND